MGAVVVGPGAQGELVHQLQRGLIAAGLDTKDDGQYGNETTTTVRTFQNQQGMPATGMADARTWTGITNTPTPGLLDRALQVTAAFEGHGFGLAQGNFDGAGITWGIIGFTLRHGELTQIIRDAQTAAPALVSGAFGDETGELLDLINAPLDEQLAWADAHSLGRSRAQLSEPWRTHFSVFGAEPTVQALQLDRVRDDYFGPASQTAATYTLTTELGIALCFDIHVQDGGISARAAATIRSQLDPTAPEPIRRTFIADAVAASARPAYQTDVAARKRTLATGRGIVHGRAYDLDNWGLDETPA